MAIFISVVGILLVPTWCFNLVEGYFRRMSVACVINNIYLYCANTPIIIFGK